MKRFVALIILLAMLFAITGCSLTENHDGDITSEPETITDKDNSEDTTESVHVISKTEYYEDGSVSLVTTNSDGKTLMQIDYDANTNITIQYVYEYSEYGTLLHEYSYEGEGNLIEEFATGNYEHATSWGENHYADANDYDVDIEHAFEVTIEELAPLYDKAKDIWNTYGVAVLIADKVSSWTDGAQQCLEYTQIERCLNLIEGCLACYPENFFRDFSDNGITTDVCIQLVGTGSSAGVYMGGSKHLLIQIDVNDYAPEDGYDDKGVFFCYTLHHEIFHMIDDKLQARAEQSMCPLTEEVWNQYNPEGFAYVGYYDDEKESELYTKSGYSDYFVYSYSCSTPGEDRAIIFGNAMTYYQGYQDNEMGFGDKIDAKLEYLSACMRAGFQSKHWPQKLPWEYILDL